MPNFAERPESPKRSGTFQPSPSSGPAFIVVTVLFAAAGLVVTTLALSPNARTILLGLNDFPQLYLGPKLLADHELYSFSSMMARQAALFGRTCEHIQYVRLPYLAVLMWPLSLLPYGVAYPLWQICSVGALGGFIRLWHTHRPTAVAISCWFPPVAATLANAQDVTFLLLWIGLGARLFQTGFPFTAGCVLALCAAKFHLFLFIPVLVVAGRLWKFGLGLAAGCSALLAISFIAAGRDWPVAWYHAVLNPLVHPDVARLSLLGKLSDILSGPILVAAVGTVITAAGCAVWLCARRSSFPLALSVAVAAGPLCAFHVYLQDYLVWLPLVLILSHRAARRAVPTGNARPVVLACRPSPEPK
jgi:hypothetical protein